MEYKNHQHFRNKRYSRVAVSSIIIQCFAIVLVCNVHVSGADSFKDGLQVTDSRFYIQQGRSQRISCTSLADVSDAVLVAWYKVPQAPDGTFSPELLVRFTTEPGGNYSAGPRYQMAPDSSLVIKSLVGEDGGTYRCQKVASTQANNRKNDVQVVVLDEEFPIDRGIVRNGRNITVRRSQREIEVSCPIGELSALRKPTLYWSMEIRGWDEPTDIIVKDFSDGETLHAEDIRVRSRNSIILPLKTSGNSLGFWCHVSSTQDNLFLQSARIFVNIQDDDYSGIVIGLIVLVILILLLLAFLIYWQRDWMKREFFKDKTQLEGPQISSGYQDQWKLEFYLGPKGIKFGGKFSGLKSVAILDDSRLAVLDNNGLYTFSQDLAQLDHVAKLKAKPEQYVALETHPDGQRLLLGTRNGDIHVVRFRPFSEKPFCSLQEGKPSMEEGNTEDPCSISQSDPLMPVSSLTDLAVDTNGDLYAGDSGKLSIAVFDREGKLKGMHELGYPPKILAGGLNREIFVHDGNSNSSIKRIRVNDNYTEAVFIQAQPHIPIYPVNLFAYNMHVFVVRDAKCNNNMEILQFDVPNENKPGNFLRQFASPWQGIQGMRIFASGKRLALYDHSIVRIYRKQDAENPMVTTSEPA